ncbi:MAG: Glu/Leu/Phe/Val family dehydrogenase [Fibrobacterota bacterium]
MKKRPVDFFNDVNNLLTETAGKLDLEKKYPGKQIVERIIQPDKIIQFRISLQMDNGNIETLKGFRVQNNDSRGPYKGGIRFHHEVDIYEVRALAAQMTLKTSVIGLPLGGGKGGVLVPERLKLSNTEKERLSRKFVDSVINDIGNKKDIPAPDMNTDSQTMAWMADQVSKYTGENIPACFTGKPINMGGIPGRTEATGFGAMMVLEKHSQKAGIELKGKAMAVQGFGNVGSHGAMRAAEISGIKVTHVSNAYGAVFNEAGIEIRNLIDFLKSEGQENIKQFPGSEVYDEDILCAPVDIIFPAAVENSVDGENAGEVKAEIVLEGANGPVTAEADRILDSRGITVLPDILVNAGGVTVSYFEMVQDESQDRWPKDRVFRRLQGMMNEAYDKISLVKEKHGCSFREAAYMHAVEDVAGAIHGRGVQ